MGSFQSSQIRQKLTHQPTPMETRAFQDFDAFTEAVRDVDFTMLMQNPSRRHWSISHVELDGIHIQYGQEGSGDITEGRSRTDGFTLFVPIGSDETHTANGAGLHKSSIIILEPGCDFYLNSKTAHEWYSIFIPSERFSHSVPLEESSCRVQRTTPELSRRFSGIAGQILAAAGAYPEIETARSAAIAAAELLDVVESAVGDREHRTNGLGRPVVPRQEVIPARKGLSGVTGD